MPRVAQPRARLYRVGAHYYCDLRYRHHRERRACLTTRRGEAEQFAARALDDLKLRLGLRGAASGAPLAAYSVAEAIRDFLAHGLSEVAEGTRRMYRSKGGVISGRIGHIDVAALAAQDVSGYLDWRRVETLTKDHTLAKEVVTLRRALAFAEQRGEVTASWRAAVPVGFRSGYDPRDRWLTGDEYLRLLAACEAPRRLWVTAGCYLGGRESELKRLVWSDVDVLRGFVVLRSAKVRHGEARRPRHIPLHRDLRSALLEEFGEGRVGLVFPDPWQNPALMLTRMARTSTGDRRIRQKS
jgi:hypothetical protein